MMTHVQEAAAKYGLILQPGKAKIMINFRGKHPTSLLVGAASVDALDVSKSERYLGRSVCLGEHHQTELANRIKSAWPAFSKCKGVFASRSYSIALKAKLLSSVVTSAVLYNTASWTFTQSMQNELTTVRRKMLQMMVCMRKPPDEGSGAARTQQKNVWKISGTSHGWQPTNGRSGSFWAD